MLTGDERLLERPIGGPPTDEDSAADDDLERPVVRVREGEGRLELRTRSGSVVIDDDDARTLADELRRALDEPDGPAG